MCKKLLCMLLCGVLVFLCACGGGSTQNAPSATGETQVQIKRFTRLPGRLQKREAVYVSMEPDGSVRQIDVTDRLLTDAAQVRVEDISALQDIHVLTSPLQPEQDGLNLTWHMDSTELYYTGTTTKSLPVSLRIRYYLNGKEMSQQTMRGKKGTVQIDVQAQNNTGTGARITPFLLVGGMLIPKGAQNIRVESGGNIGDGNRDIAFGLLLPGIADALGLDALGTKMPTHFSVSFTVERYTPDSLYFALVPLSTERLGEAVQEAFGGSTFTFPDLTPLLSELQSAVQQNGLQHIWEGLPDSTALFHAAGDAMQAYSRQAPLLEVLQKYLTPENAELLRQSIEALSGVSVSKYAALVQDPVFLSFVADLGVVSEAFLQLIPTVSAFLTDLQQPQVLSALQTLPDTLQKLADLTQSLEQNRTQLEMLSDLSANGTFAKLAGLMHTLQSFLDSGTIETLQSITGQADQLRERLEALLEAGKKYDIFTLAPENAECSVYFILKTNVR